MTQGRARPTSGTYLNDYGRWVRTTFGCRFTYESGAYHQRCPVAIAHKRVGMSVGFTVRKRICSICGTDWADCPHSSSKLYDVPGGRNEDVKCRVCVAEGCTEHPSGQTYRTPPIAIVTEVEDLHEVSLVRKPAQPDARPTSLPVDTSALGSSFRLGAAINCNLCIRPCKGIEEIPWLALRFRRGPYACLRIGLASACPHEPDEGRREGSPVKSAG